MYKISRGIPSFCATSCKPAVVYLTVTVFPVPVLPYIKIFDGCSCLSAGARMRARRLICSSLCGRFCGVKEFCSAFFSEKKDSFLRKSSKKTFNPFPPIPFQKKRRYINIVVFSFDTYPIISHGNVFLFFSHSLPTTKTNKKQPILYYFYIE